jgi:hypothetical protein
LPIIRYEIRRRLAVRLFPKGRRPGRANERTINHLQSLDFTGAKIHNSPLQKMPGLNI